jgi:hypothetical protein
MPLILTIPWMNDLWPKLQPIPVQRFTQGTTVRLNKGGKGGVTARRGEGRRSVERTGRLAKRRGGEERKPLRGAFGGGGLDEN